MEPDSPPSAGLACTYYRTQEGECVSEMRWKSVPAADRAKWKTQMET
ncbi:MAG TPA: hypothetical protein VFG77_05285 [Nitrososphaeraceae archaeon]|nr:hypothetical protein [Nitrososphaeraceae archaeon]